MRESYGSMMAWRWSLQFSRRASPSTTEEEEVLGRERAVPREGCGSPPTSPLFIGARERGAGPLQMDLEGGAKEGGLPPKPRGAPPLGFSPTLGAWSLGGFRPTHLGAVSPSYSAHRALWDRWTLPVDPRNPFGGPGTIPINLRTLLVTE